MGCSNTKPGVFPTKLGEVNNITCAITQINSEVFVWKSTSARPACFSSFSVLILQHLTVMVKAKLAQRNRLFFKDWNSSGLVPTELFRYHSSHCMSVSSCFSRVWVFKIFFKNNFVSTITSLFTSLFSWRGQGTTWKKLELHFHL